MNINWDRYQWSNLFVQLVELLLTLLVFCGGLSLLGVLDVCFMKSDELLDAELAHLQTMTHLVPLISKLANLFFEVIS